MHDARQSCGIIRINARLRVSFATNTKKKYSDFFPCLWFLIKRKRYFSNQDSRQLRIAFEAEFNFKLYFISKCFE